MKAVQFSDSIPRYAVSKAASRARSEVFWGRFACLQMRDVEPPALPNEEWLRVRTRYGGVCGSDLGTITLHSSTSTSVFTSFPFTFGHENVGVVDEVGRGVTNVVPGQRVVVNPLLPCEVRGFDEPCEMCVRGDVQLCQRFDQGVISPGLLTGFCRDTGGSWSREFIAHRSQVLCVPDNVSDEQAVLTEPFAVALHPVIRDLPGDDDTVLIVGGGVIGLCTIAAIRGLGSKARIVAVARHKFQAKMARDLGADVIIGRLKGAALEQRMTFELGATALKPILGKNVIVGGAQYVYDCVGSPSSVNDALRYAGPGGKVVLIGLAGVPHGVDWTPIWLNELTVKGSFCYGIEEYQGDRLSTMAVALRLMSAGKVHLEGLLTHRFKIDDYQQALATMTGKSASGVIKAVFEFDPAS